MTNAAIKAFIRSLLTDPESTDNIGDAPIHRAAAQNPSGEVVGHILEAGGVQAQLTMKNGRGVFPVHCAAGHNPSVEVIREIVTLGGEKQGAYMAQQTSKREGKLSVTFAEFQQHVYDILYCDVGVD